MMTDFQLGIITAASLLIRLHDLPVAAADILINAGCDELDCSSLDDFDKEPLKKLDGRINLKGII